MTGAASQSFTAFSQPNTTVTTSTESATVVTSCLSRHTFHSREVLSVTAAASVYDQQGNDKGCCKLVHVDQTESMQAAARDVCPWNDTIYTHPQSLEKLLLTSALSHSPRDSIQQKVREVVTVKGH